MHSKVMQPWWLLSKPQLLLFYQGELSGGTVTPWTPQSMSLQSRVYFLQIILHSKKAPCSFICSLVHGPSPTRMQGPFLFVLVTALSPEPRSGLARRRHSVNTCWKNQRTNTSLARGQSTVCPHTLFHLFVQQTRHGDRYYSVT